MIVAADLETFLMTKDSVSPKPVCLSYYAENGDKEIVAGDDCIKDAFIYLVTYHTVVFHNSKFDLGVMATHYPELIPLIFEKLHRGVIKDTQIREQLFRLSTEGKSSKMGESLADISQRRLGKDMSRYKKGENIWRLRYSELYGKRVEDYPFGAKKYCLIDVKNTLEVYLNQEQECAGYHVSPSMGTEDLQTLTAFCLQLSTIKGIKVDTDYADKLSKEDIQLYESSLKDLVDMGYAKVSKKGAVTKESKMIRQYLLDTYPSYVEYTTHATAPQIKIGLLDLKKFPKDPLIDKLIAIAELQKNCTSYYPHLANDRIHPNYGILKATGRTCSFGGKLYPSLNIQQLPREGGLREAFVPAEGNVFIGCDYAGLELASVAQTCLNVLGESNLLRDINAGLDIHSSTGALISGIPYEEFMARKEAGDKEISEWRTIAKPINLGIPGGMYARKMSEWAQSTYGVDMSYEDALEYRKIFMSKYPEIQRFFNYITKIYGKEGPFSYTINGRHRADCRFTDMSNGFLMQSLSADGAKLAVCSVTEAFYDKSSPLYGGSLVAFIHDELIIEVSKDDADKKMECLCEIMADCMSYVMPDVRISVEAAVMDRWRKEKPFISERTYYVEPKGANQCSTR